MEIKLVISQEGKFSITVSEGVPVLMAIGALDVAKSMLIGGDIKPTTEPKSEVISDEEKE